MSGAFDIQEPQQPGVFPKHPEMSPATPPPAGDDEGREREFVNQVRRLGRGDVVLAKRHCRNWL